MEWGNLPGQVSEAEKIIQMIDFLLERNFTPYGNNNVLIKEQWKSWPWDIYWKKAGV
jgi:hypothetical protein